MDFKAIREAVNNYGARETADKICRLLREGKIDPDGFSLRKCWEAFIGPVDDTLPRVMQSPNGLHGTPVIEEVKASAFTQATSGVLINFVQRGYDEQPMRLDELVTPVRSNSRFERFIGFTAADSPQEVAEGEEYPSLSFSDRGVAPPEPKKVGFAIDITDEAIRFDHTGQIVARARAAGRKIARDREAKGFKAIQDLTGNNAFYPIVSGVGTQKALYHNATSGGDWYESQDNLAEENALTDWTSIEAAWKLLRSMTDENGDPIQVEPTHLLVPPALLATAAHIVNASRLDVTSGSNVTVSANAVLSAMGLSSLRVIDSVHMDDSTTWFLGDFKSEFVEWIHIDTSVIEAPGNPRRDIVQSFIARRKSAVYAVDDKFVIKNTA